MLLFLNHPHLSAGHFLFIIPLAGHLSSALSLSHPKAKKSEKQRSTQHHFVSAHWPRSSHKVVKWPTNHHKSEETTENASQTLQGIARRKYFSCVNFYFGSSTLESLCRLYFVLRVSGNGGQYGKNMTSRFYFSMILVNFVFLVEHRRQLFIKTLTTSNRNNSMCTDS